MKVLLKLPHLALLAKTVIVVLNPLLNPYILVVDAKLYYKSILGEIFSCGMHDTAFLL